MSEIDTLLARVLEEARNRDRLIVAIAGPPGSGKSTLARKLVDRLNAWRPPLPAVIFPMDGFHLDNELLAERGLLARKGAPATFDTDGYARTLERIRAHEGDVAIPLFDRTEDRTIPEAATIGKRHRVVVTEGNYLLMNLEPWDSLAPLFDLTVYLRVDPAVLEKRLIGRWTDQGHDAARARDRALTNDLPNARLVATHSVVADVILG